MLTGRDQLVGWACYELAIAVVVQMMYLNNV